MSNFHSVKFDDIGIRKYSATKFVLLFKSFWERVRESPFFKKGFPGKYSYKNAEISKNIRRTPE